MGVNSLDRTLGKKQGYTATLLARGSEPVLSGGVEIARALGVRLTWLATGEGPMDDDAAPQSHRRRFCDLPGWAEAERKARVRYKRIPEEAWEGAGLLMAQAPLDHVDESVVLGFAQAWLTSSSAEAS